MRDELETEWQFECADPPQRWLRRVELPAGFSLGPATVRDIKDTYYDTEDWRLYRAGYALRLRQVGRESEVTMKQLAAARDGRHQRRELTSPIALAPRVTETDGARPSNVVDRLDGLLAERIHAVAGTHAVAAIVAFRTRRRRLTISRDGRALGELALDVTSVPVDDTGVPTRFHRIEVEVAPGVQPAELQPLIDAWSAGPTLAPIDESKFEAALRLRGIVPSPVADLGPCTIDAAMTTGAVALAWLRAQFATLLAHEPGTRLGDDPEALHDMRVAIRRLRATLALFADALPARAAAHRATLGWLADALGAVRDLDVQLERLAGWRVEMETGDAVAMTTIADVLRRRRVAARRRMLQVLDCRRYDGFIRSFSAMLSGPVPRRGVARRPIVEIAPTSIRTRIRKVRKKGADLMLTSPPPAYHELRIRAKKLRYALEAHADVYGKPVRRLARVVSRLQDLLGKHQDAEVAVVDLRALCERRGARLSPRAIFVIGRIAERYEREARRMRRRFPRRYRAVTGGRWKRLRRAMDKHAARRREAPDTAVAPPVPAPAEASPRIDADAPGTATDARLRRFVR